MKDSLNLIVMLTYNDETVKDAYSVFEQCRNSKAEYFGCKEKPLPLNEMKELFKYIKQCNKKTVLEVVAYTEEEGIEGAKTAVECGCDILMGTMYYDSINAYCKENNIKYMPFIGRVYDRPSVLEGNINEIIIQGENLVEKGIDGFDLLGYRYTGNATELNKKAVSEISLPVCIAGSIDSFDKLDEIKEANPWAFTIGSAFFDKKYGKDFTEQINRVFDYVN